MIYVYGDSHARQFAGEGQQITLSNSFTIHKLVSGAEFEGQWSYDESGIASIYLRDKPKGFPRRPAVIIFGEPDVRFGIWGEVEKGRDKIEVMETLIGEYIDFMKKLGGQIILSSITPASDWMKMEGMDGFPGWQHGFWARKGPLEERIFYTRYMNGLLKVSGFPFINVHDFYADENGQLRYEMTHDGVHICPSKNAYIIKRLKEVL
jgi:hypothetical protein